MGLTPGEVAGVERAVVKHVLRDHGAAVALRPVKHLLVGLLAKAHLLDPNHIMAPLAKLGSNNG